jgi:hypothetical protein
MQDNADIMRHILMVIIALLALNIFIPSIWAQSVTPFLITGNQSQTTTPDVGITTTPSIAAFLNDSWVPSSFVPPTVSAPYTPLGQNATSSTYNIYDFLNNSWVPSSSNYQDAAANNYPITGLQGPSAIYQVLNPDWTQSTQVAATVPNPGYKMHQMG